MRALDGRACLSINRSACVRSSRRAAGGGKSSTCLAAVDARGRVDLDAVPLSRAFIAERGASRRARLSAATGGDDYCLLAALPADVDALSLSLPSRTIMAAIGTLEAGSGMTLFDAEGEVPLPEQLGYEHRRP